MGARIRSVRKRRGLTQQGLADLAGVSASLIRKLEQDARKDVRLETLRKVAVALKVPTTSLMTRLDAEPADEETLDLWTPVRRALHGLDGQPTEAPTGEGLGDALEASMPLWKQNRYTRPRPRLLRHRQNARRYPRQHLPRHAVGAEGCVRRGG